MPRERICDEVARGKYREIDSDGFWEAARLSRSASPEGPRLTPEDS